MYACTSSVPAFSQIEEINSIFSSEFHRRQSISAWSKILQGRELGVAWSEPREYGRSSYKKLGREKKQWR